MKASEKYLSRYQAILKFPNLMGSQSAYDVLCSNFEDLRRVVEDGEAYCAVSIFAPSELLRAMDVHFLPLEPVLATASQLGIITDLKDIRNSILVSDTSCCGCQSLLALYERGIVPLPKYFIACSHMCDDSLKAFNFVAQYYDVPIFNLDVPYSRDDAAVEYLRGQMEALVAFISEHEGVAMDPDALRAVLAVANSTNRSRQDLLTACKHVPPVRRLLENLPSYPLFSKFGRTDVMALYESMATDVRKRVDAGAWAFPEGCYRVLWLGMIPLAYPRFLGFLESLKLGVSMTELMLHSDFEDIDTRDPLLGIARKIAGYPLVGSSQIRVDKILQAIEDYEIEAVIHFNHRGCIAFNGDNFIFSEILKARDIPFLVLEGDIADKEHCSEEKLQRAVTDFHGILEARYGKR